jgi:hypothetical protein
MPPSDSQRPSATSFTVQKLVERARHGFLRVPDWQRLFHWQAKNIRELLDSIVRGYPVGTLLLWKRPTAAPAARIELGPHTFDAQESIDANWVIDGQQRVTTLAGVLLRRGSPDREPETRDAFTWAYDLVRDDWVQPKESEPWKVEWLPADRLVDSTDLIKWLMARQERLTPAQRDRALALARDVREFEIPALVVATASEETLRRIFDRVNNAGKKLRVSEVFDALHGALSSDQPSTLRALAKVPEELDFGSLPQDWLLRLVVQVNGGDMTQLSQETRRNNMPADALPRAADALRRALVFVKSRVGIPNQALLPYRLPLIVLSVFFDRHPEPRARSLDLLARWVWRGAETGVHRGQDIGQVRALFAAIDGDEERSVQRLLASVAPPQLEWAWQPINLRSASTRLELLAMLSLQPRRLDDGALLEGPHLADGKLNVLRLADDSKPLELPWTHLAHRLVHPAAPRQELLRWIRSAEPTVAGSHGISPEAQEALREGHMDEFLRLRNRTVRHLFQRFIAARSRWSEPSRPSLEQLVLPDPQPAAAPGMNGA